MTSLIRQAIALFSRTCICILALPFLLLSGCGSVDVNSRADSHTDFARYHTFNFAPAPESPGGQNISPADRERVMGAIRQQMERRAFRMASNPDLVVSAFLRTQESTYDKSNPDNQGGSLVENVQKHYGIINDEKLGPAPVVNYTEGTLVVQLTDVRSQKPVWQGVARGVMHQGQSPEKAEARIREAVSGMFERFPAPERTAHR